MGFGGGFVGFGGPSSVTSSRDAGLPFAGVPGNLADQVREAVEREPEHPEPVVEFSHRTPPEPPLTLRSFLAPVRGRLVGASVLVMAETALLQAGPLLTKIGIDAGVAEGDRGVLVVVALVFVATIVLGAVTGRARVRLTGRLGEDLMYRLRIRVFSHLQRQSLDFYTSQKAGVLMTRMTSDIEALTQLFQEGLVQFAVQGLTLLVIVVILFLLNLQLALITLLAVVPATLVLSLWFRRASDRAYGSVRDRIADVLSDLQESLAGIRVIAAHNRRRHNVINHRNVLEDHRRANLTAGRAASLYAPGSEAIGITAQAIVVLVGGRMVLDGSLTIGELTAFLLYVAAFFAPIQALTQLYNGYQQGQSAVAKLRELLSTEPSVPEAADAVELPPITGEVALDGVTFGYDPDQPVLHDVDLTIAPGETIAVVGPTGAGKSTIAKLVARFYDPGRGRVRIDGHDLRTVAIDSLRHQLGVVPQEPFLFAGTVRDNVTFGRPDATDGEVAEALDAVGVADLVAELPDGVDTVVHERGASLSAGERQLLALARVFLERPRVLVLDEATSNLDLESEARIERAVDCLLAGRTSIVIAHRLATAMQADRVAVVDDGRIIELGSHDQLVAEGGIYAGMYATWAEHTT